MAITVASLSTRELKKNLTLSNWPKAKVGKKKYRNNDVIKVKIINTLKYILNLIGKANGEYNYNTNLYYVVNG
jgi:hypothetical protein